MKKLFQEEPIFVQSQDDINNLKPIYNRAQLIKFKCFMCGKDSLKQLKRTTTIETCLCRDCRYKRLSSIINTPERLKERLIKTRATSLLKYGATHYLKTTEGKERQLKTRLEKFGAYNPPNKGRKRIEYDGFWFDSTWELCYYIYNRDNGINIIPHPNVALRYTAEDGRIHFYEPDFLVDNNQYVEIKGSQFFVENGYLINPFDRSKDLRAMHKHISMIRHKVLIIKSNDIVQYINFVLDNYPNEFVKNFNISKPHD